MDQVSESKLVSLRLTKDVIRFKEVDRFEKIDFPELIKKLEHEYSKFSLRIWFEKFQLENSVTFHIEAIGLGQNSIKVDVNVLPEGTLFQINTEHGERNSSTSKHCAQIIFKKIAHAADRW